MYQKTNGLNNNELNKIQETTKPYEFACLKCRQPTTPLNNEINIKQHNSKIITVKAMCNVCNIKLNKAQNINKLQDWSNTYNVLNKKEVLQLLRLYHTKHKPNRSTLKVDS